MLLLLGGEISCDPTAACPPYRQVELHFQVEFTLCNDWVQLAIVTTKDNGRTVNVLAALATTSKNYWLENAARLCAYRLMPGRIAG